MIRSRFNPRVRRGVTIIECALVYPLLFLFVLGLIVVGMGVYRYQEVASLARAAARYASTHGAQYRRDMGLAAGSGGTMVGSINNDPLWYQADPLSSSGSDTSWTGDIYDQAVRPNLIALDSRNLTCKVAWPKVKSPSGIVVQDLPDNWPGSKVTVTISYQWLPEILFVGPITLTSTSTMPITN